MGQYDSQKRPCGFVRMIDQDGVINEGHYTADGLKNGFCITMDGGLN